jgi:hypothetical protein
MSASDLYDDQIWQSSDWNSRVLNDSTVPDVSGVWTEELIREAGIP